MTTTAKPYPCLRSRRNLAYSVSFSRRARREFDSIYRSANPATRQNLSDALTRLEENPYPLPNPAGSQDAVSRLRNVANPASGEWRIRVGNYRVRYRIYGTGVVITRVAHRSEVYGDL